MTISLCPLVLLSALRTYEIQGATDRQLEKSSNSLFLVIVALFLLIFGCWYGYIPMSCSGGPVSNAEGLEVSPVTIDDQGQILKSDTMRSEVAVKGVDLSYHSLDNHDLSHVARAPDEN